MVLTLLIASLHFADPREHSFDKFGALLLEGPNLQLVASTRLQIAHSKVEPLLMSLRVIVILHEQFVFFNGEPFELLLCLVSWDLRSFVQSNFKVATLEFRVKPEPLPGLEGDYGACSLDGVPVESEL